VIKTKTIFLDSGVPELYIRIRSNAKNDIKNQRFGEDLENQKTQKLQ
jgi:hypothetical protein